MPTEKLVDSAFISKLLAGSFEMAMGGVEEAVLSEAELFGGDEDVDVRVIGTYARHAVVANTNGDFFRCEWTADEAGEIELRNVEHIDVPVVEAEIGRAEIRRQYESVVEDLLECRSEDAEEKLRDLLVLVNGGVPMTAEAVETVFLENRQRFDEADWRQVVSSNESSIRKFLGAEALRLSFPKPQFEAVTQDSVEESAAEGRRDAIVSAVANTLMFLEGLRSQTSLARTIDESYVARGSADPGDETTDFVEFVAGFSEDLDGMISIVEDAMAVSEDGCAKCLARLHDGIASQMREWAFAAAFAEKMARRFQAAA